MNIASAESASTPLNVPSRTFGAAGGSLLGGAAGMPQGRDARGASEPSSFLSLVTGLEAEIPAPTPGQIEPEPLPTSDTPGGGVNDKSKESTNDLSKDTKNHKKEESPVLAPLARPLQEPVAFLTKPVALELAPGWAGGSEQATWDENNNTGGSAQHADIAPNPLAPVLPALTPAVGDVAFALRLTPNRSETVNTEDAVARSWSLSPPQSAKSIVTEAPAKREFPEFRLSDNHAEGSGKTLAVAAWPSDAAGAPDTRAAPNTDAGTAPAGDASVLKVASEPEIKMGLAPPVTRQISLNLSTDDSTQVNIGVTERAGKVLVAVRTLDHELAQSLQTDLGDLVGRLESKGFKTETWIPAVAHQEAAPLQSSNSNTSFNQPQHSSAGNGGGQQSQGRNNSTQRQKERWAAQLDETISGDQARSES